MAKSKRRPGGGRKPIGEFPKSAAFTTRLEPTTRRALDAAARASECSVSAMAEILLKAALKKPTGSPRNQALAAMVEDLAKSIERDTEKDWNADPWTGKALRYAVEALLFHFTPTPDGEPIPAAIEQEASAMPPDFAKQFRTAAGFGHMKAYNFIHEIEQAASNRMPNELSMPVFFSDSRERLQLIARDLAPGRKGKPK